eukprot:221586_1
MDRPPVPSPRVKSPPWIMKLGITLWKALSAYPNPFSPVARARKFSTVLGTVSPKRPIVMRPALTPPISMSKKDLFGHLWVLDLLGSKSAGDGKGHEAEENKRT